MATSRTKKDSVPQEAESPAEPKKGPAKTIRVDDCSVSFWPREREVQGQVRTFWSMTFERSYVDKKGTRRYTGFFSPESLAKLVSLCQQAEDELRMLPQEAKVMQPVAA